MDTSVYFPSAENLREFPDVLLKEQFEEAVQNDWPMEWIDRVLDEKNRRDAEFRNSLRMGFQVAIKSSDLIVIPAIPCP